MILETTTVKVVIEHLPFLKIDTKGQKVNLTGVR